MAGRRKEKEREGKRNPIRLRNCFGTIPTQCNGTLLRAFRVRKLYYEPGKAGNVEFYEKFYHFIACVCT